MIKTEERTIDGKKVVVTQLPARKSIAQKIKLFRIFGPAFGKIMEGSGNVLDKEIDFADVIQKLFQNIDENSFIPLVQDLFITTTVDGMQVNKDTEFDLVFSENLMLVYKVIGFTLEVNYKSFLGEKAIGLLKGKFQAQSLSGQQAS